VRCRGQGVDQPDHEQDVHDSKKPLEHYVKLPLLLVLDGVESASGARNCTCCRVCSVQCSAHTCCYQLASSPHLKAGDSRYRGAVLCSPYLGWLALHRLPNG